MRGPGDRGVRFRVGNDSVPGEARRQNCTPLRYPSGLLCCVRHSAVQRRGPAEVAAPLAQRNPRRPDDAKRKFWRCPVC